MRKVRSALAIAALVVTSLPVADAGATPPPAQAGPTIAWVSPGAGATSGLQRVTIAGAGFTPDSVVHFGTRIGRAVNYLSSTRILSTAPTWTPRTVDVRVTTTLGTSPATAADHYTYRTPTSLPDPVARDAVPLEPYARDSSASAAKPSCPVAGWCAEVGPYRAGETARIYARHRWITQSVPLPTDAMPVQPAGESSLDAVSCPVAGWCAAYAHYRTLEDAKGTAVLVLDHDVWSARTLAGVTAHEVVLLQGLSCGARQRCTIIGGSSTGQPYLAQLDGTTWTRRDVPVPSGAPQKPLSLVAVDCPSATWCAVAGAYTTIDRNEFGAIVVLDGDSVVTRRVPTLTGGTGFPTLMDCAVAHECTTIGAGRGTNTAVATFDRAQQRVTQLPAPPDEFATVGTTATSVSCPSASTCFIAALARLNAPPGVPGADSYVASVSPSTGWRVTRMPAYSPAWEPTIADLDCPQTDYCVATGSAIAKDIGVRIGAFFVYSNRVWTPLLTARTPTELGHGTRYRELLQWVVSPAPGTCLASGTAAFVDNAVVDVDETAMP